MILKLQTIGNYLKTNQNKDKIYNYTIPDLWNTWGYQDKSMIKTPQGEHIINPYHFFTILIEDYYLKKAEDIDYHKPIHRLFPISHPKEPNYIPGDWIKRSVVYSMMIRTSSAWDSDRSGTLDEKNLYGLKETGTFLKTIALLPYIKEMGVDVIYLLPISKYSIRHKKGELGSPYSVANFYELDQNLKDSLLDNTFSVDDEFQAFIEACHILNMKVMIDIIPRTNAIDNDLIKLHPDWFYWIKSETFYDYHPPVVPTLGAILAPKEEYLEDIYQSIDVWKHIRKFSFDPKTLDQDKYKTLVDYHDKNPGTSFLELVENEFGLKIAPAFSDHINDPQPPWSDVTFFRMYLDHPIKTKEILTKHIGTEDIPPYILFDTIKNNYYKGNLPNHELWEMISNIIPYYQTKFGIDGARIDMGHALSGDLLELIISKARKIDPDFCFIAEELNIFYAEKSRQLGYNMIIGSGFTEEPRYKERKLHAFMYHTHTIPSPVFALGETHDTPRLAAREGGKNLTKMLTILNYFVPNGVPFINSGQELYEVQPMNIGLDARPDEAYQLLEEDIYYGKLALFDKYAFHYTTNDRWDIPETLKAVSKIREQYLDAITDLDHYLPIGFEHMGINCIGFGYIEKDKISNRNDNILLIFANTEPYQETYCKANLHDIRNKANNYAKKAKLLFSQYETEKAVFNFDYELNLNLHLKPAEVKIIKL